MLARMAEKRMQGYQSMQYRIGELIQTFRRGTAVIGSKPDMLQTEECYRRTFSRACSRGGSSNATVFQTMVVLMSKYP